jgi:hypothetical protein
MGPVREIDAHGDGDEHGERQHLGVLRERARELNKFREEQLLVLRAVF